MAQTEFDRLVLALAVATGIEAFVWLTDIATTPTADEALDVMRFSAHTLLEAASR